MERFPDIAAAVLLLYFTVRGWMKGAVTALFAILSVAAAYVVAVLYARPVADQVVSRFVSSPMIAYPAASFALFTGTQLAAGFIGSWIAARFERKEPGRWYWLGGAAIGAATGVLYSIPVVWAFMAVKAVKTQIQGGDAPVVAATVSERATKAVLSSAVEAALDLKGLGSDRKARAFAQAVADPEAGLAEAKKLLAGKAGGLRTPSGEDAMAFLDSPEFRKMLENPDLDKLLNNPALKMLAKTNPELGRMLEDPQIKEALKRGADPQKLRELIDNPEFREKMKAAASDPKVKAALEEFR